MFYHHNHACIAQSFLSFAQLRSREGLKLLLVALICGSPRVYTVAVNFYKIVLKESDPVSQKLYTLASYTLLQTMCVYMTDSISTSSLFTFTMHTSQCYLSDHVCVVVELHW